jgi:hypothetical protein
MYSFRILYFGAFNGTAWLYYSVAASDEHNVIFCYWVLCTSLSRVGFCLIFRGVCLLQFCVFITLSRVAIIYPVVLHKYYIWTDSYWRLMDIGLLFTGMKANMGVQLVVHCFSCFWYRFYILESGLYSLSLLFLLLGLIIFTILSLS